MGGLAKRSKYNDKRCLFKYYLMTIFDRLCFTVCCVYQHFIRPTHSSQAWLDDIV